MPRCTARSLVVVMLAVVVTGCMDGDDRHTSGDPTPWVEPWSTERVSGTIRTPAPDRTLVRPQRMTLGGVPALGDPCTGDEECGPHRCAFGQCYPHDVEAETGMSIVPGGWAVIGSSPTENGRRADREVDRAQVLLHPFLLDRTPITEGQWRAIMGNRRASQDVSCGLDCPVERVTWWSALEFANRRSMLSGFTPCYDLSELTCTDDPEQGKMTCSPDVDPENGYHDAFLVEGCTGYRLPAELEWEHAFRGGTSTAFPGGDLVGNPRDCMPQPAALGAGWHCGNSTSKQPVAQQEPNGYLLYDMAGNVREWVADVFVEAADLVDIGAYRYVGQRLLVGSLPQVNDPYAVELGYVVRRVQRGGSWRERPEWARASARSRADPNVRHQLFGFRLARTLDTQAFSVRTERCRVGQDACTDARACLPCPHCPVASDGSDGICLQPHMAYIPPGTFVMGSPPQEVGRGEGEEQRTVTLTNAFSAARTELTVGDWHRVMGRNPDSGGSCGPSCPVDGVSWWSALAFANALSIEAGLPPCYDFTALACSGQAAAGTLDCGDGFPALLSDAESPESPLQWWYFSAGECIGFRLPTEAEWEYMARAGSSGPYQDPALTSIPPKGCTTVDPGLDAFAAYCANAGSSQPVGQRGANHFGLLDVHGNVSEWVYDAYEENLANYPSTDPRVEIEGPRVHRGGHAGMSSQHLRAAARRTREPGLRHQRIGFRLVQNVYCAGTIEGSENRFFQVGTLCGEDDVSVPDCGPLEAPASGTVDHESTLVGAVATYACSEGSALIGDASRACDASGTWSGDAPTCEGPTILPLGEPCTADDDCEPGAWCPAHTSERRCSPNPTHGDVSLAFQWVPQGTFTMGSPVSEVGRDSNEAQVSVTLTRNFFVQREEVTQEQWQAVMSAWNARPDADRTLSGWTGPTPTFGTKPSCFLSGGSLCSAPHSSSVTPLRPVERVSWIDAVVFANVLSRLEGLEQCYQLADCVAPSTNLRAIGTGCDAGMESCYSIYCNTVSLSSYACSGYRLPFEAEWERAARGATSGATYRGELDSSIINYCDYQPNLSPIAYWCNNAFGAPQWVRGRTPNTWGLYDVLGNIDEWVGTRSSVAIAGGTDPTGPTSGWTFSIRGGNWNDYAYRVRSASRTSSMDNARSHRVGFRLARTAPQ